MPETITLETLRTQYNEADSALGDLLNRYQDTPEDKIPVEGHKAMKSLGEKAASLHNDIQDLAAAGGAAGIGSQRAARQQALAAGSTQTFGYGVAGVAAANKTEAFNMAAKTIGQQFAESDEYKNLLRSCGSRHGDGFLIGDSVKVPSTNQILAKASAKSLQMAAAKSLITGASDTSAGAFVRTEYYPNVDLPRRPLDLIDLVTHFNTTSDLVEYVRFTSRTNNAAATAEATTTSNGTKPESALALAKVQAAVKTIAHWIPVTRRALSDASQIRAIIDSELIDGVLQAVQTQMISGDGTGENFEGLETVSGTGSQAFVTDIKTTIRKAITQAQKTPAYILSAGAQRTNRRNVAILLHPDDMETIDLDVDAEMRFYTGGPVQVMAPMLWGLPCIVSEAVTAGTGWVLDTKTLILWDREETTVRQSEHHASFFIQNLVAMLGEGRWAFGVSRPSACIELDLTA